MLREKDNEQVIFFDDVVEPDLNLLSNPRFVAFLTDVAINTFDPKSVGKDISIPILDKFRDLIVRLHSPSKQFEQSNKELARDLSFTANLTDD